MFIGFRRGNNFILKVYKDSIYNYIVCRIDFVDNEGSMSLIIKRVEI